MLYGRPVDSWGAARPKARCGLRVDAVQSKPEYGVAPQLARALVSRRSLVTLLALTGSTLLVFALRPDLDLDTAAAFYAGHGHFIGDEPWGSALRSVFSLTPFVILGALVLLYGARRLGLVDWWSPRGRAVLFLIASLAMGRASWSMPC